MGPTHAQAGQRAKDETEARVFTVCGVMLACTVLSGYQLGTMRV